MKGPLAWQAVWTDGWSSSAVQGEAPAEWVNHRATNCSSQHVCRIRLTHSLFSWPHKNVVLWWISRCTASRCSDAKAWSEMQVQVQATEVSLIWNVLQTVKYLKGSGIKACVGFPQESCFCCGLTFAPHLKWRYSMPEATPFHHRTPPVGKWHVSQQRFIQKGCILSRFQMQLKSDRTLLLAELNGRKWRFKGGNIF